MVTSLRQAAKELLQLFNPSGKRHFADVYVASLSIQPIEYFINPGAVEELLDGYQVSDLSTLYCRGFFSAGIQDNIHAARSICGIAIAAVFRYSEGDDDAFIPIIDVIASVGASAWALDMHEKELAAKLLFAATLEAIEREAGLTLASALTTIRVLLWPAVYKEEERKDDIEHYREMIRYYTLKNSITSYEIETE